MIIIHCKECGQRHPAGAACEPIKGLKKAGEALREAVKPEIEKLKEAVKGYDRNAAHTIYMRDYMRKKRAKDKDKLK